MRKQLVTLKKKNHSISIGKVCHW